MSSKPQQRPMSPYMLGPYYKFQITSLLSISSRITGVFLTLATAPAAIIWLLALANGPESYQWVQSLLSSFPGQAFVLASLFSLCYHLLNGLRHLSWDAGKGFEMSQIRASGYIMLVAVALLFVSVWMAAS